MSFSNLSPAERLKVALLGGLIVIVLFVVAHMLLGALSPKKSAAPPKSGAASKSTPASNPAGSPAAASATVTGDGFTGIKLAQAGKSKLSDSPDLDMDTHDPFVPLPDTKQNGAATPAQQQPARQTAPGRPAPDVSVKTPRAGGGLEIGGGMSPLPPLGSAMGGGPMSPAAVLPPPEPTIKVVGIVHGDPSVATIQVANRTVLARPGDVLHNGYRLLEIEPDAVVIRCKGQRLEMRVGAMINEPKNDARTPAQQ